MWAGPLRPALRRTTAAPTLETRQAELRLRDADYAACDTATGVTRRLRLQVVGFFVNDYAAADDRFLTAHRHHAIGQFKVRFA